MSGNIGKYPIMSLTFDGNTVSPEVEYDDRKGWGSYDVPTGTWAYNVTDLVAGSGTYTTVVTNIDPDAGSSFCMGVLSAWAAWACWWYMKTRADRWSSTGSMKAQT